MRMSVVNSQGNISGEYHIAVLSIQKPIKPFTLDISQHLNEGRQCTFSLTIKWKKFFDQYGFQ